MIKISCEGATSLEVLSHIKGFAALIGAEVPAKTGAMPEDIVAQAVEPAAPVLEAKAQPIQAAAPPVMPPSVPTATPVFAPPAPAPQQIAPAAVSVAAPVPAAAPVPVAIPSPMPAPAPAAVPAAVPIAAAPGYTSEQLSRAGAALVDAGKRDQLVALLLQHGVQALTQLDPAQYGAFATELRGLGAQI